MPSTDKLVKTELRKLARQGRLVDQAFKTFQRAVFPNAPPDVVHGMRTCFFAGAAELWALVNASLDESDDVNGDEEAFMGAWVDEIEAFHKRTIAAMQAGGARN